MFDCSMLNLPSTPEPGSERNGSEHIKSEAKFCVFTYEAASLEYDVQWNIAIMSQN